MMTVYEARGIEKGMQQGMQQGEIKIARQDVLEVLELKFAQIPYLIKEKINYCDDLITLKNLLRQAVLITSIDKLKLP
jgi:hypothetical protein